MSMRCCFQIMTPHHIRLRTVVLSHFWFKLQENVTPKIQRCRYYHNFTTHHPLGTIRDQLRTDFTRLQDHTVASVLRQCRGIEGLQIHSVAVSSGLISSVIVSNSLMNMYCKSGSFNLARNIFAEMSYLDVVSWNTILSGFSSGIEALEFFVDMRRAGVPLDHVTFTTALSFAASLQDMTSGQLLHCLVVKSGFVCDNFVGNALILSYARSSCLSEAKAMFDEMMVRDLVSWNSLMCGLNEEGSHRFEAVQLFLNMFKEEGITPDHISFNTVISACGNEGLTSLGSQIHGSSVKMGFENHLSNVLMSMYYKSMSFESVRKVFENMKEKDVISWTTMISVFPVEAVMFFNKMRLDQVLPTAVTFVALSNAVTSEHSLREGQMIHGVCFKTGFSAEVTVSNSLLTMYAKLGFTEDSRNVFEGIWLKEIESWNALISGYSQNEQCEEALDVFSYLMMHCRPNQYTFGSILSAITASQTVSLTFGQKCHCWIIHLGLQNDEYVSGALIDMYAKRGSIYCAQMVFDETMCNSLISWTAIISAHAKHGNYTRVMSLFEDMLQIGVCPDHITFLAVLVACSCKGMVEIGRKLFNLMVENYGLEPWPEHCACIVDLLGKAGRLEEAENFLRQTRKQPGTSALQSLLGSCRVHGKTEMAARVAKELIDLEPMESGAYVLISNIYAETGDWENVSRVRRGMRQMGVKKEIAFSWVDVGIKGSIHMHKFSSGDDTHPLTEEIYIMAHTLGAESACKEMDLDTDFLLFGA